MCNECRFEGTRTSLYWHFFAEVELRYLKKTENSRNIGKIKLSFTYHKAKRLSLAPECLSFAPECLSLAPECLSLALECVSFAPECLSLAPECLSLALECFSLAPECFPKRRDA